MFSVQIIKITGYTLVAAYKYTFIAGVATSAINDINKRQIPDRKTTKCSFQHFITK